MWNSKFKLKNPEISDGKLFLEMERKLQRIKTSSPAVVLADDYIGTRGVHNHFATTAAPT